MRLVVFKPYRAFKELDRFTDAECRLHLISARGTSRLSQALGAVAFAVMAFAGVIMAFIAYAKVSDWRFLNRIAGPSEPLHLTLVLIASVAAFSVCWIIGLVIRDLCLRHGIRKWLDTTRCLKCRYTLLGLDREPIEGDADRYRLTCPECGAHRVYEDRRAMRDASPEKA